MAITYRARDTVLNSVVALKVIDRKVAQTPGVRSRFFAKRARPRKFIIRMSRASLTTVNKTVSVSTSWNWSKAKRSRPSPARRSNAARTRPRNNRAGRASVRGGGSVRRGASRHQTIQHHAPVRSERRIVVKVIDYGIAKILDPRQKAARNKPKRDYWNPSFRQSRAIRPPKDEDRYAIGHLLVRSDLLVFAFRTRPICRAHARRNSLKADRAVTNGAVKSWGCSRADSRAVEIDASLPTRTTGPSRRANYSLRPSLLHKIQPGSTLATRRFALATAATLLVLAAIGFGAWLYQHAQSAAQMKRSIAVLPFENLSDDKENAYLTEGIQDEILTRLSKIGDLRVISASTRHYKSKPENLREIAKQLGVAHILEGSVQKSAGTVRMNLQLIKAANNSPIWAERLIAR